jgi:hydroxymethylbilane synthase
MAETLRIGTRGSKLALTQTNMVAERLRRAHPDLRVEIVEILTSGDWTPAQGEARLNPDSGGKALFAKEIEQAILESSVDCGVHSLKDMPAVLSDGLVIDHVLEREDPRDAFLSFHYGSFDELPIGATVGTASLRRQAFLLARRPDLKIVPLRGNVPTRIEKLKNGQADAIILALAGLKRLGLDHEVKSIIEPEIMLPAAAQGIIGIEMRQDDTKTRRLLDPLHDAATGLKALAERSALEALGGSCHTPVGSFAVQDGKMMHLRLLLVSPDGKRRFFQEAREIVETVDQARDMGLTLGAKLKAIAPPDLL